MIKKLISTILCMITLCHMGNFYSCALSWPWAEAENKCVDPKDVKIAYDSCLNDLKEGKGFCSQLKVGPKCGTDLWFWDYVQIKKALSNLKKCSLNTGSTIDEENIIKVADTIKALFKTDPEMSKEISKHWLSESIIINGVLLQDEGIPKFRAWTEFGVGGFVGVGNMAVSVIIGLFDAYMHSINGLNIKSYSRVFDNVLIGIINEEWKCGDIASLEINYGLGKGYSEHVDFVKQGIYYDENTKKEYEDMFRTLREELINIAKGNCC